MGLNQHRGNSVRMVANVAVITELERLDARVKVGAAEQQQLAEAKALAKGSDRARPARASRLRHG